MEIDFLWFVELKGEQFCGVDPCVVIIRNASKWEAKIVIGSECKAEFIIRIPLIYAYNFIFLIHLIADCAFKLLKQFVKLIVGFLLR